MFAPRKRPNRGLVPSLYALEERICLSKVAPEVRPSARAEVSILAARTKVKVAPKPKAAKNPKAAVPNPKAVKPHVAVPKPQAAKPKPVAAPKSKAKPKPKPKPKVVKVTPKTPVQPPKTATPPPKPTPPPTPVTPTPPPPATPSNPDVSYLLSKLNADRAARGLQAVTLDDGMSQAVLSRLKDYHGAGHNHSSGFGMSHGAGEVMSQDDLTAQGAYASMISDAAMLEAMMNPNATKVGIASIWDEVSKSFDNPYGRANTLYMMTFS